MKRRFLPGLLLAALLAGCGSVSLWPFGEPASRELSRKPADATEYRCGDGKVFYVRSLDAGAVWLIAPDREIRLDGRGAGRWGVGKVGLEISGEVATLADPPAVFMNCKRSAG